MIASTSFPCLLYTSFVLVLADMARVSDMLPIAQEVLRTLAQPVTLQGQVLTVCASLGISAYPRDGDTADMLIRHADLSLIHI